MLREPRFGLGSRRLLLSRVPEPPSPRTARASPSRRPRAPGASPSRPLPEPPARPRAPCASPSRRRPRTTRASPPGPEAPPGGCCHRSAAPLPAAPSRPDPHLPPHPKTLPRRLGSEGDRPGEVREQWAWDSEDFPPHGPPTDEAPWVRVSAAVHLGRIRGWGPPAPTSPRVLRSACLPADPERPHNSPHTPPQPGPRVHLITTGPPDLAHAGCLKECE